MNGCYGNYEGRCVGILLNVLAEYVSTSFADRFTFSYTQFNEFDEWYYLYVNEATPVSYRWYGDTDFPIFRSHDKEFDFLEEIQKQRFDEVFAESGAKDLLKKSEEENKKLQNKLNSIKMYVQIIEESMPNGSHKILEIINES